MPINQGMKKTSWTFRIMNYFMEQPFLTIRFWFDFKMIWRAMKAPETDWILPYRTKKTDRSVSRRL